ncbi:MAG: cation transporter [Acidimicrobiia bacterium]|nr:cation transporter [Acidimicrobiia bacterium]MDH5522022.1 cation transporter [Acidimicrobiia bacterium]
MSNLPRTARRLQQATIAWNMIEVFITVGLGLAAGSLALVAFGLDSLIEVFASLVVLWHLRSTRTTGRDRLALRLVAGAFAMLGVYLAINAIRSLLAQDVAAASPLGIAYLAVTAVVMFTLARWKKRIGLELGSEPFLAEANLTYLDGWLATGILTALALNWTVGWWWADPLAAFVLAGFAVKEAAEVAMADEPEVAAAP